MNILQVVNACDSQKGFRDVETRHFLGQDVLLHEQRHQVAALQVLHDKIQIVLVLETALELDNPWIIGQSENITLSPDMRHLILVNHFLLLHFLDGNYFVAFAVATNTDLTEGTSANDLARYEIVHRNLGTLQAIILTFFVQDLLLDNFFFLLREAHYLHLLLQLIPCLLALTFFIFGFSVFILDIGLGTGSFLASLTRGLQLGAFTLSCSLSVRLRSLLCLLLTAITVSSV